MIDVPGIFDIINCYTLAVAPLKGPGVLCINAIIARRILIEVALIALKARDIDIIRTVRGNVRMHIRRPWIAEVAALDSTTRRGCIDCRHEEIGYVTLIHPPSEGSGTSTLGGAPE